MAKCVRSFVALLRGEDESGKDLRRNVLHVLNKYTEAGVQEAGGGVPF